MKFKKLNPKFTVILLILAAFHFTARNQPAEDIKTMFLEAESYYLFEEYKDALPLYQKILAEDPENYNINYKIGICYLNDPYLSNKSVKYLEKAAAHIDPKCNQNSLREKYAPPEALFFLGNAYRVNNRLDEAVKMYKEFLEILDPAIYDDELVKNQINSCKTAMKLKSSPDYVIMENLGEIINSQFSDINAVISGDESTLIFTRKLRFYDAVFQSKKVDGNWGYPINLTPDFALDGNSYSTGLSYKGDEIFVYRSDGYDGNIYSSKFIDGKWTKLEKLNDNINTKFWESHASISADGKFLYFTSNRKDGYGGLDIYRSERTGNGDWGPAVNLGSVINSKYNEDTPFITTDGKTLYFSSLGHNNMGGYDIFYSTLSDDGKWSKPVNIGYPVNTTGDDIFYVPGKDDKYAYYSIYERDEVYGLNDIFRVEVYSNRRPRNFVIQGKAKIADDIETSYKNIKVSLFEKYTNKLVDETTLMNDGTFKLKATQGDFLVVTEGQGIQKDAREISIPIDNPDSEVALESEIYAEVKDVIAAEKEPLAQDLPPEMEIKKDTYVISSDDIVPIRLNLDKNTNLTVETYNNGNLTGTENFEIKRKKFIYDFKPLPGKNLLKFILSDENGNINERHVTVEYNPPPDETLAESEAALALEEKTMEYMEIIQFAEDDLKKYLENINWEKANIKSIHELYEFLSGEAEKEKLDANDVNILFIKYLSSELDMDFIYQSILFMPDTNLRNLLTELEAEKKDIDTSGDLLNYLWNRGLQNGYSTSHLMESLINIKTEEYKNIELFLSYLKKHATGNLKSMLQDLNIREKNISTFTDLLEYLISCASLKGYSRESVYQLLIDLIEHENLEDFVSKLKKRAGDEIMKALDELDITQFSNALELIQYLISHTDIYTFNETDILNLLLKVIFAEGVDSDYLVKDLKLTGKKANTGLIVPAAIVIIIVLFFLIFFIIRKKQKK
jgi:tetratricopeptide (TPR) repeat protein